MLDILEKGGVIMWIIMFLSVIAAVLIIERLFYFRRIRVDEGKMINRLKSTLKKGHFVIRVKQPGVEHPPLKRDPS